MHRILAFGCHPDDVEFMCAGTLAMLAQRGCEIHIALMAGGEMGSPTLPRAVIHAQRMEEARAAAAVIGAQLHFAGGHDIEVEYNAEYRRRAVRVMRAVNPTIASPNLRLLYDVYHMQIMGGNVVANVDKKIDIIGPQILRRIGALGYPGRFGLEYFPKMKDHLASLKKVRACLRPSFVLTGGIALWRRNDVGLARAP